MPAVPVLLDIIVLLPSTIVVLLPGAIPVLLDAQPTHPVAKTLAVLQVPIFLSFNCVLHLTNLSSKGILVVIVGVIGRS